MTKPTRREAIKQLTAASAALALSGDRLVLAGRLRIMIAGRFVQIAVSAVSASTVRITARLDGAEPAAVPYTGALVKDSFGPTIRTIGPNSQAPDVRAGSLIVKLAQASPAPVCTLTNNPAT